MLEFCHSNGQESCKTRCLVDSKGGPCTQRPSTDGALKWVPGSNLQAEENMPTY